MKIQELFPEAFIGCQVGDRFNLWTKPGLDYINGYAPRTLGGIGLAFRLLKRDNPVIAEHIAMERDTWVTLDEIAGRVYTLTAHVDKDRWRPSGPPRST